MTNIVYAHRLIWNEDSHSLEIYRQMKPGNEILYTTLSLEDARKRGIKAFCQELGEVLVVDSPVGRALFDL
jgi:hypothetical protein